MRGNTRTTALGRNVSIDQIRRTSLINKINKQIQEIVKEMSRLHRDKDEESLVQISDLTQQRDRLMSRLEELELEAKAPTLAGKQAKKSNVGRQLVLENDNGSLKVSIVSESVVDPSKGEISPSSPLGREIVDKKEGEVVEVQTPGGVMQYKILQVT